MTQNWIPPSEELKDVLLSEGKVADIGCGFGISTLIMAKYYPKSQFQGFDNHKPSIDAAIEKAKLENVVQNLEFSVLSANESIGNEFDLVIFFDTSFLEISIKCFRSYTGTTLYYMPYLLKPWYTFTSTSFLSNV